MPEEIETTELPVREACIGGDYQQATTLAIKLYSDEVLGFLHARTRSRSDANEVYSLFVEAVWKGLPTFEWRCSLRGWCYTLARNAANRFARSPHNRADHNLTFSKHQELAQLVEEKRTNTQLYAKTEVKDRMRQLREKLPEEDQALLILRVDRGLPWRDLAVVMHGDGGEFVDIDKSVPRLRKRFERIKERLRDLARADGLL